MTVFSKLVVTILALTVGLGLSGCAKAFRSGTPSGLQVNRDPGAKRDLSWTDKLEKKVVVGVPVHVIRVNLQNPKVKVQVGLAKGFPGTDQSAAGIVRKDRAVAAVNGSYFSMSNLKPIGDIVVDGELVNFGGMGTVLAIAEDGTAVIGRVQRHRRVDWSSILVERNAGSRRVFDSLSFSTVLGSGPALVLNGQADVAPRNEGFQQDKLFRQIPRMGVGLKSNGELLMVYARGGTTFDKFAKVFLALGCTDAMGLDAGASLFMYYRGRTVVQPGRKLTNLLEVVVR